LQLRRLKLVSFSMCHSYCGVQCKITATHLKLINTHQLYLPSSAAICMCLGHSDSSNCIQTLIAVSTMIGQKTQNSHQRYMEKHSVGIFSHTEINYQVDKQRFRDLSYKSLFVCVRWQLSDAKLTAHSPQVSFDCPSMFHWTYIQSVSSLLCHRRCPAEMLPTVHSSRLHSKYQHKSL